MFLLKRLPVATTSPKLDIFELLFIQFPNFSLEADEVVNSAISSGKFS
jgi:hypothetical protein